MAHGSVQAQNRTIEDWFHLVRSRSLKLPRFQRHEAWDRATVVSLVETVPRGLPAGAALVLNVGEPEPFISRHLVTAPDVDKHVTEHLLDGQQRLTALWRSLYATYDDLTLFATWQPDPDHEGVETVEVVSQPRWARNGKRYPVWCDDPADVFGRGYVPVTLLAPDAHDRASNWLQEACGDATKVVKWINKLAALRQRVAAYNIPYLYLPQSTPRDVALDVFVKMNTSNIRLSPFDIVVAQVEAAADASMHEILEGVDSEVPNARAYGDLGTLLLDIACLQAGRVASKANYLRLDHKQLPKFWGQMVESLRFMVGLLEGEGIYDEARLPSSPVVAIVAALAQDVPPLATHTATPARCSATTYGARSSPSGTRAVPAHARTRTTSAFGTHCALVLRGTRLRRRSLTRSLIRCPHGNCCCRPAGRRPATSSRGESSRFPCAKAAATLQTTRR
jgi:Protein of unknown function DUF262